MYFIYQRISTEKQSLLRQDGEISRYCKDNNIVVPEENIYKDIITGKTIKRENYQKMKARIEKGDFLIILDLDRLGRNWDIIKSEWKDLTEKGVNIIVVNCPVINVLPDNNGKVSIDRRLIQSIMFELLCYLSQKEVEKLSLRTVEGIRARRELLGDDFNIGRPRTYDTTTEETVLKLRQKGHSYDEIAERVGVSKSTVARYCRKGGGSKWI